MSAVEDRLGDLGLVVPAPAVPLAAYVPAVRTGQHIFTSGQLPLRDGRLIATGKVGGEVSTKEAAECARLAALNAIAALKAELGDLDRVVRVVKVVVFVASTPDFVDQPSVANGASELLDAVFGEAGKHARSAVGVAVLPVNSPVEIEIIVEVR